ncbi:Do family serine endopeptidase [Salinisphaera sp.]|uniref:Do family serine endopeptidase n=1 Tax=Salinisphaera sp. TaxID=1914330 RepID=UPI002D77F9B7|nr:Do family serine endopeptidase [Salinisphaera sp.]HET7314864.1 Do family serine endopeptidase [Salinisphaera sp.]
MQMLRRRAGWVILAVSGALVLAGCGGDDSQSNDQARAPDQSAQPAPDANSDGQPLVSGLPDFSRLVKKVSPAVVNISALPPSDSGDGSSQKAPDDALGDWLRKFFGDGAEHSGPDSGMPRLPDSSEHVSLGSGFIISPDGYILTNRHVVAGAGQIVVKLNDRRQLIAKVVGADPDSDVAVLKVEADHLPTVQIGDPDKLDVGAWVVAIGSPFGFETSVTAGIVSAKGRSLADDQYVPFLQTDVAINPGNSGGPLFNLAGKVVGINSQIYSQTGGYQGVSFAIPIDIAMHVAKQLRTTGHVTRGWLGVQIQNVDRELAQLFELARPEGALVTQIFKGSPASEADIHVGDIILACNGHPVDTASDLPPLIASIAPGEKAKLKILRDGDTRTEQITIAALPPRLQGGAGGAGGSGAPGGETDPGSSAFGLTLESLDAKQRRALGLDRGGVRVTDVAPGPAAEAGLQAGDVILSVGSTDVEDRQALLDALRQTDGPVALLVLRDGVRLYLPMQTGDTGKSGSGGG